MIFVIGFLMLAAGVIVLRVLAPKDGNQPAFVKQPVGQLLAIFGVQIFILGGLGLLIGGFATLAAG